MDMNIKYYVKICLTLICLAFVAGCDKSGNQDTPIKKNFSKAKPQPIIEVSDLGRLEVEKEEIHAYPGFERLMPLEVSADDIKVILNKYNINKDTYRLFEFDGLLYHGEFDPTKVRDSTTVKNESLGQDFFGFTFIGNQKNLSNLLSVTSSITACDKNINYSEIWGEIVAGIVKDKDADTIVPRMNKAFEEYTQKNKIEKEDIIAAKFHTKGGYLIRIAYPTPDEEYCKFVAIQIYKI